MLDSQDKKYSNTNKIRNKFGKDFDMFIVPAVKDNSQVTKGRGKGGLATLWKKSLTKYVSKVSCSNFRLQVTKFSFSSGPLLVINGYFPCDPRQDNFDDTEILSLLAEIASITRRAECPNVFLAADLNCHFNRNTRFTRVVLDSLTQEMGLTILWQNPDNKPSHHIHNVDYTHLHVANDVPSYSTIDHFVVSS